MDYFACIGYESGKFENPADFFMKILYCNYPKTVEDEAKLQKLKINYEKVRKEEVWKEN